MRQTAVSEILTSEGLKRTQTVRDPAGRSADCGTFVAFTHKRSQRRLKPRKQEATDTDTQQRAWIVDPS